MTLFDNTVNFKKYTKSQFFIYQEDLAYVKYLAPFKFQVYINCKIALELKKYLSKEI